MPNLSAVNLAEMVSKFKDDTHHLRLKLAPEMFHLYCQKMPEAEAKNLTCELLRISHAGFDYALQKDPLGELYKIRRNHMILKLRGQGYSFAEITKITGLSRVQVWRIIQSFEDQLAAIRLLEHTKVRRERLTYDQLENAKRIRNRLSNAKGSAVLCTHQSHHPQPLFGPADRNSPAVSVGD